MPAADNTDSVALRLSRYERVLRISQSAAGALLALVTVYAAVKFGDSQHSGQAVLGACTLTAILISGAALAMSRGRVEWQRDLLARTVQLHGLTPDKPISDATAKDGGITTSWPAGERLPRYVALAGVLLSGLLLLIYVWLLALGGEDRSLLGREDPKEEITRVGRVLRNPIATTDRSTGEVRIAVLPGEALTIRASFNAQRRHRVRIVEMDGAGVASTLQNLGGEITKANLTTSPHTWIIYDQSVKARNSWERSRVLILEERENYVKAGFDDSAGDGDYDDATVEAVLAHLPRP